MSETWLILGATSSMARALARALAERGDGLVLAGRDGDDLAALAADCRMRGARLAEPAAFDARRPEGFEALIARVAREAGVLNAAVFVGSMPDQAEIDADPALIDGTVIDSFSGPARVLQMLAPEIEARGAGTVVGVGSVAGDRGRLGNYVYGGAKAGFHAYLSGLRNRLTRSGGHVVTVKPGPVDTAMTWGLPSLPFMTTPETVARDILRAVARRRNVIYSAWIWWAIMLVIRLIPEPLFKKLSI
ncbi:MAG: SDR family NAD(P)-dependent oxidoreductase [Rhodobacter sp.]|nr:SDR family NAD(P)-dependent oxidoreductase [Rhodobacter sp.]